MRIGYARISIHDQNLNLQLNALKQSGCEKIYKDEGISGTKAKRPGLDKALKSLNRGDHLIVWRLDRLGRSVRHLIELTNLFEARGVAFTSLSDGIDTSTASGKLFFHITSAFAEFERNLISKRTKAGMAAAKTRGVKLGRPKKKTPIQEQAISEFERQTLDDTARAMGACGYLPNNKVKQ